MQNNKHKSDSNCAYGETLVAVLYGEAAKREIDDFESHSTECQECRDEFAAFGALRSAVSEWREIEFAPLELSEIVLPSEVQTVESNAAEKSFWEKTSWLETLRGFFTPANFGWQMATAGFAVFVILGILFIGTNDFFKRTGDVAQAPRISDNSTPKIAAFPKAEPTPGETTVLQTQIQDNVSEPKNEKVSESVTRINRKIRKPPQIASASVDNLRKRRTLARKTEPDVEDLGVLPIADADDASLRLTDLFEEIEPSS